MAGSHGAGTKSESNAIFVSALDSKDKTLLMQARSNVVYASGFLLFMRDGILMAQSFDPGKARLSGDPVPVAEGVQYEPAYFRGAFAASENGVVLYAVGLGGVKTQLRWFDRAGKPTSELFGEPAEYTTLSVSPDGKRIAAGIADPTTGLPAIWILDDRGGRTRLAASGGMDGAVWSPDGSRIAYAKFEGRATSVCVMPSGGGPEQRLFFVEGQLNVPSAWSEDGRFLAIQTGGSVSKTKSDIWIVPMGGAKPYPFLATAFDETAPSFSPDGKWLSYTSDESGRPELYVVPFPGPGGRWQISTDGSGGGGGFSGKDLEIIYGNLDRKAFAVDLKAGAAGLEIGESKTLFQMPNFSGVSATRGAERIVMALPPVGAQTSRIGLIANWTAGLTK